MGIRETDPSSALEAAFRRIEVERMAGVGVLNPALAVEVVGFSRWQDYWLGVLVTPWFMNLVLVPASDAGWKQAAGGERIFHRFASGDYAFLGGQEPEAGEFQSCALFSPMDRFPDQESARAVAREALLALHAVPAGKERATAGAHSLEAGVTSLDEGAPQQPQSRREFLHRIFMRPAS